MKSYTLAFIVFIILLPFIFLGTLLYQRDMKALKNIISLNINEINPAEIWMSLFVSLVISMVLACSLL